jgi:hypothetical protein
MSACVLATYRADPLLSESMRLSGATELPPVRLDAETAADRLRADDIRFVLLDRIAASEPLRRLVETLQLEAIAADDRRTLYVVRNQD